MGAPLLPGVSEPFAPSQEPLDTWFRPPRWLLRPSFDATSILLLLAPSLVLVGEEGRSKDADSALEGFLGPYMLPQMEPW